jgi:hypothetical protein
METSSAGLQSLAATAFVQQTNTQPQEQLARNLRSERERDEATSTNDQVTLSGASRQLAARETERVVPQSNVTASADKSEETDRVEQVRQNQVESQRNEQPVSRSVARALESYTQTEVFGQ